MRMVDAMLSSLIRPPGTIQTPEEMQAWRELLPGIGDRLKRCEMIVADNVAEFFFAGTDQEVWDVKDDFPGAAPPFEEFWVEWRTPSRIVSRETGVNKPDPDVLATGILFEVRSWEAAFREWAAQSPEEQEEQSRRDRAQFEAVVAQLPPGRWEELESLFRAYLNREVGEEAMEALLASERYLFSVIAREMYKAKGLDRAAMQCPPAKEAWQMSALGFLQTRRFGVVGPVLCWAFDVDAQGNIVRDPNIGSFGRSGPRERLLEMNAMVFPALLTLSFLNCKNVKRIVSCPDAPLNRKYRKRTGRDLCRFWTLEIEPMRTVLQTEGQSEKTGLKKALHVCRGHFADYSDGKGLFGKYHGRYWVPNHMRGAINEGIVDKVYAMKKVKKGGQP